HEIERVDAVRYFMLLTYGGVYIDLDMQCLHPIDRLLAEKSSAVFSLLARPTLDNTVIGNAFMAAPPGHPLFVILTKQLPAIRERDITHADVLNNTGPDMLTRFLSTYGSIASYETLPLDSVCGASVLEALREKQAREAWRAKGNPPLCLIHHHANSWNLQHPPPQVVPDGYQLFLDRDIHGCDIDYVEYAEGDYDVIARQCNANPDAIGFNFNGYIKSAGGALAPYSNDATHWLKDGITPWICIKEEKIPVLKPTAT
ncbi:MAG: glycosyltransferase, partial [Pseudomonadota bacterium]